MELSDLVKIIVDKPCTCFIGAGFSKDCGGPDGDKLLLEIKRFFSDEEDPENFFQYLEKKIGFNKDIRKDIEKLIKTYLSSLTPNDNQKYLLSVPWKAVLTTNYDLIPDNIELTLDKNREILTVVSEDFDSIDIYRNDVLYCFKLFGDIKKVFPEKGYMILTETDRRFETTRIIKSLNLFKDLSLSGNIIYIGYSFKDKIILDILKDMKRSIDNIPWNGYIVKPNPLDEEMEKNLSEFDFYWVKGDVESLVTELKAYYNGMPNSYVPSKETLVLNNTGIIVSKKTQTNCRNYISYVHNELFTPISESPQLFFEGRDSSLYPFIKNWDIQRQIYPIEINNKRLGRFTPDSTFHVLDRQLRGNYTENIKIALIGNAGSGKSIVAKRIAFNWYKNGHPVIIIEPKGYKLDKKVIEGFIEEITFNYQKRMEKENSDIKLLRFLIISDNQPLFIDDVIDLYEYLTTKEILVDLLIVERTSNLIRSKIDEIHFDGVYKIDDTLDPSELQIFLEHFSKINLDIPKEIFKKNIEDKSINESFFALMYTTIKESQKPLKSLIIDEYKSLDDKEKEIYALVSLLEALNMKLHRNLICKYSNTSINWLDREILEGRLNGILGKDYYDDIISRHRIISEIIDGYEFFSSIRYFDVLNNIVDKFTPGNFTEEDFIHTLLISKITFDRMDIRITPPKVIDLYERTIEKLETRPLFHHLARNYLKIKNYQKSQEAIVKAKKTYHPRFGESEKNLLDTQGRIELVQAQELIDNSADKDIIWDHLEKAEKFFDAAQIDIRVSPHPVQGLSQTYYMMGLITDERNLKHNLCLLSLSKLNYLNKNIEQSYRHTRGIERNVYNLFSTDFDEVDAENIITNYKNPDGYAYLGQKKLDKEDYYVAEKLVDKGLKYKTTLWLLRLKIVIIKELYPYDIIKLDKYLSEYIKLNEYDLTLSFELGKYYFKIEDYKKAYNTFNELKNKSQGYVEGYKFNEKNILYEDKEMKYFRGDLIELPSKNKSGLIRSDSLLEYSESIKVRIVDIKYEHPKLYDRIYFNLYFTFEGAQAFNVTPR